MRNWGMLHEAVLVVPCGPGHPVLAVEKIKLLQDILVHSLTAPVMLLSGHVCGQGLAPALGTV